MCEERQEERIKCIKCGREGDKSEFIIDDASIDTFSGTGKPEYHCPECASEIQQQKASLFI